MNTNSTPGSRLLSIHSNLMTIHRGLLQHQKHSFEIANGKKVSPHDLLTLSLQHPDFQWLRVISQLIIEIDVKTDEKKDDLAEAETEIRGELNRLFGERGTLRTQLKEAASADPLLSGVIESFLQKIA